MVEVETGAVARAAVVRVAVRAAARVAVAREVGATAVGMAVATEAGMAVECGRMRSCAVVCDLVR